MIKCNLAVLLAERNLKISELSKRTGISRTTLTALAQNQSKGIQFDTFDTICTYLKVSPNDLFKQEVLEYDFSIKELIQDSTGTRLDISLYADITFNNEMIQDLIKCDIELYNGGISNSYEISSISVKIRYPDYILNIINSIPISFKTSLEEELLDCIKAEVVVKLNLSEDIEIYSW